MILYGRSFAAFALTLSIGFGAAISLCAISPTEARDRAAQGKGQRVTACSRFGNGCVSGRVRPTQLGYQVQLRSGTWIYCRGDCRQTLLEETIDFWDSQNEKAQVAVP